MTTVEAFDLAAKWCSVTSDGDAVYVWAGLDSESGDPAHLAAKSLADLGLLDRSYDVVDGYRVWDATTAGLAAGIGRHPHRWSATAR